MEGLEQFNGGSYNETTFVYYKRENIGGEAYQAYCKNDYFPIELWVLDDVNEQTKIKIESWTKNS